MLRTKHSNLYMNSKRGTKKGVLNMTNNNNLAAFDGHFIYSTLKSHYLNAPQLSQFQDMIINTLDENFEIKAQSICAHDGVIVFAFTCNSGTVDQLMKYISYALCDYEEFLEHHNRDWELPWDELCENVKNPFVERMVNEGHFKAVAFNEMEWLNQHPKVSSIPTLKEITEALRKDEAMVDSEFETDEINHIWFYKLGSAYQLDTVNIAIEDYMDKHVDYED